MPTSYKVKVRDSFGHCCCNTAFCIIKCSTRGGIATLAGIAEYTDPGNGINASIPPKKYRTKTLSDFTLEIASNASCMANDIGSTWKRVYSGGQAYSLTTGLLVTDNGNFQDQLLGCFGSTSVNTPTTGLSSQARFPVHVGDTVTKLQAGIGCNGPICGNYDYADPTQLAREALSDEDTEADAISRIPGITTWSAYSTCNDTYCCRTAWELRGAGQFDFEYVESRFRVIGSGAGANALIKVEVDLLRKPYGTGIYALYQTVEDTLTANPDGTFDVDFGVTNNTIGYETVASNCRVTNL